MVDHPLLLLEPEDGQPVFSNMIENINEMKNNYKKIDEITHEIRHSEIEDFLEFDSNGKYELTRCETCDGPILGHLEVKCRTLDGVRYDGQTVKSFENWLKRINGF